MKSGLNNDVINSSECIFHGDEILMRYEKGSLIAKISDMGLGKQLTGQSSHDLSTLGNLSIQSSSNDPCHSSRLIGAGPGSIGWQAPEVMAIRWSAETPSIKSGNSNGRTDPWMESSPLDVAMGLRATRSVDIFSLGCIFHYTLIPGSHPFGDWYEREANIMRNRMATDELLQVSPEAHDLIISMISRENSRRPTAAEVCEHPYFWQTKKKLTFLCEFSDRVEIDAQMIEEGRAAVSKFSANIFAIESNASRIVGIAWDQSLDPDLISNTSKFRSYDTSSVRDCLRLIRNKHHHYDELPNNVKETIGSNPDGLFTYFEQRFPLLFMHCYNMCKDYMEVNDQIVLKYLIPMKGSTKRPDTLSNTVSGISAGDSNVSQHEISPVISRKQPDDNYEFIDKNRNEVDDTKLLSETTSENENGDESFECINQNSFESCMNSSAVICEDVIIWEGSTAAKTFKCRGWFRTDEEWIRRGEVIVKKMDNNLIRCATDPKFRTRLCNHWDSSLGTFCPMLKRHKCIFAHGPVELRVKEGKKTRWGKLVDSNGNCSNPNHSGGEDTYGAARSIEAIRKDEGKWNTDKISKGKSKNKPILPKK
jgi:serine/threonine-protein kinase/endoribonuclease IRE1